MNHGMRVLWVAVILRARDDLNLQITPGMSRSSRANAIHFKRF